MRAIAQASRHLLLALVVVGLLGALTVPDVAAATFSVRLEAGPQRGVTFDSGWRVTGSKTVTLATPITVTGSRRVTVGTDRWLRLASGSLAGRWVKESRVAYVPGYVGQTTYSPYREGTLAAGRYELYRFGTTGNMAAAAPMTVAAATTFRTTGRAFIKGRSYVRIADGAWAGWWLPGVTSSPTAIRCTAGSPPSGTTGQRVSSVPAAAGEIALTFDMGGRLTDAMKIMKWLELERICATIFPTGAAAQTTIGRQVMAEIEAHPELFELGNHTVHHCNLRDGGGGAACPSGARPSTEFVHGELQAADAILSGLAGRSSVPYWRPPYGAVDTTLVNVAAAAGYPYTMMWSTDTIDWRPIADGGPTASQIAAKVIAGRRAGAIVLMHLGGYNTRNALAAMVTGLYGTGYTPTTLSALYRSGH
jgi:peptidoglycan/xylan/chitin deacetylase (PgdA/CDA1 family)